MRVSTVLFDLDGTLIDSGDDIVSSALFAFAEVGVEGVRREGVGEYLGYPLDELYDVISADGDFARREMFVKAYRAHYAEHCTDHTVAYPGVRETLKKLSDYRLAVATTKPSHAARKILDALALSSHFSEIRGCEGLPSKPNPAVLLAALASLNVRPDESVMVGDTDRDMLAGRAAGMRVVAVTYGGWSRDRLMALRPDALVDRFDGLLGALALFQ
jgi:phosphoglycolate phosphatase